MKAFFQHLFVAIASYGRAFRFLSQHRLWKYVFIPALIYLLIYGGLLVLIFAESHWLSDLLAHWLHADTVQGGWGDFLTGAVNWIVRALLFLLYFKLFRYIILILAAPAMAMLAERTQEILTGISHPFDRQQFIRDVWRGIRLSLRNLLVEWLLTIPLYFLLLVPVLNFFVSILILCIESYFVGFSMIDYRNEFRRMSGRESRQLVRSHRGLAVGIGLVFTLSLAIPIAGVLLAPMLAVVAAALAVERVLAL